MNPVFFQKILKSSLLVGTLDILTAFLQFYLKTNKGPAPVLTFIASAVFGKRAFTAGDSMLVIGLFFHYFIAFLFTLLFFWLCDRLPLLLKWKVLTGVLYGVFIWAVMNLFVLPLSHTPKTPFTLSSALVSMAILIVCMGVPLAFLAANQNKRQ